MQQAAFELNVPTLSVAMGECVGLVGANGAGKSTLLRILANRTVPTSGVVYFLNRPMAALGASCPEFVALAPDRLEGPAELTVIDHLELRADWFSTWDLSYAKALLDRLDVPPRQRLSHLSRGNQAKLGFIACEGFRPTVLLLDEPTSELDPLVRTQLRGVLQEAMRADSTRCIVFSTHLTEDIEEIADRMLLLAHGVIVGDVPVDRRGSVSARHEAVRDGLHRLHVASAPARARTLVP